MYKSIKSIQMKTGMNILKTGFLLTFASLIASAQSDQELGKIETDLRMYYDNNSLQKVYVQTDNDNYNVKQTIWFKAYVSNATNLKSDTLSSKVYVQLVDPLNKTVVVEKLKLVNGSAFGNIWLADSLISGTYHLCAYTSNMQNSDKGLIFSKPVQIKNTMNYVSKKDYKLLKRLNKQALLLEGQVKVNFFPEGGQLVNDLECNVVFQTKDGLGHPKSKKGKLIDKEGKEYAQVESNKYGLGTFKMKPEKGANYYLVLDGSEEKFTLPSSKDDGVILNVKNEGDKIVCNISSNESEKTYYIIAHVSGNIGFSKKIGMKSDTETVSIPYKDLKSGVSQILLLDISGKKVAERLVFVNNRDLPMVSIMPYPKGNTSNDSVLYVIKTMDLNSKPMMSDLTVSVFKSKEMVSEADNIRTYLQMNSEISGDIDESILSLESNEEKMRLIDQYLITEKSSYLNWDKIISDRSGSKEKHIESGDGLTLKGKIEKVNFESEFIDVTLTLTLLDESNTSIYMDKADGMGEFEFEGIEYYGDVEARIDAKEKHKGDEIKIKISEFKGPDLTFDYQPIDIKGFKTYKNPSSGSGSSPGQTGKIYGMADYTLRFDDVLRNYSSLFEAMNGRIPGVAINGADIVIRGVNTINSSIEPLVVLDGVIVGKDMLNSISPKDVDYIDLLTGASTASYGSRGGNGVICIYTLKGEKVDRGTLEFVFHGYHIPEPFQESSETTLYWQPIVITNMHGYAVVRFKKPGNEHYVIHVEGMSEDGIPISMSYSF